MPLPTIKWALKVKWMLIRLDPPLLGDTIVGQFQPEEYSKPAGAKWATQAIPRRVESHIQWTGSVDRVATFDAIFWAEAWPNDVSLDISRMEGTVDEDPILGRPPRYRFVWGGQSFDCVVLSLGGPTILDHWADGRPRGALFRPELRELRATLDLAPTDPSAPVPSTRYVVAGDLDTWETVAQREYGDPNMGAVARQGQTVAFPLSGQVFALPLMSTLRRQQLVARSVALADNAAGRVARANIIQASLGTRALPLIPEGF